MVTVLAKFYLFLLKYYDENSSELYNILTNNNFFNQIMIMNLTIRSIINIFKLIFITVHF